MATTKKSTKAKSKTAKKPATKTTKPASAVKKSIGTSPINSAAAVKSSKASRANSTDRLTRLQMLTAFFSAVLAVLAVLYMSQNSYQLFTGLLTRDELASTVTTVFVPAIRSLYDVEVRWLVAATMAISALFPLLYLTRLKRMYEQGQQRREFLWRWVENGVVGALIVVIIALLSGVQDIMTLKLMGGLVVVSALLAWVAEKQHAEAQRPATAAYLLSVITGFLPWLLITVYAVATPVYGMVRNTGFVYALYAIALAGFIATALNLRAYLQRVSSPATYEVAERNYSLVNLLVRIAFAITVIVGLIKQ